MKMARYCKGSSEHGAVDMINKIIKRNATCMSVVCVSECVHYDLVHNNNLRMPIHDRSKIRDEKCKCVMRMSLRIVYDWNLSLYN